MLIIDQNSACRNVGVFLRGYIPDSKDLDVKDDDPNGKDKVIKNFLPLPFAFHYYVD